MPKFKVISLSEGAIIVHSVKRLIHFFRPIIGIEEEMNEETLTDHIQSKFRKWKQ